MSIYQAMQQTEEFFSFCIIGGGMSKNRCCHGNSAFTPYFQKLSVYCIHQSILHILGEFQLPSRLFYRDITVEGQGPGKSNILRK